MVGNGCSYSVGGFSRKLLWREEGMVGILGRGG